MKTKNKKTSKTIKENLIRSSKHLWKICKIVNKDVAPWGKQKKSNYANSCDDWCMWFIRLEGDIGLDWGICANPKSHRVGLLTFEGFSCTEHKYSKKLMKMIKESEASGYEVD